MFLVQEFLKTKEGIFSRFNLTGPAQQEAVTVTITGA